MAWVELDWIGIIAIAYLIGSIPSAYLAGRLMKGIDIRSEGDRNPGAGNAYRSIGPRAGMAVAVADVGKGAIAVLVARGTVGTPGVEMMAGLVVVIGHNWPVFLQLRGGRGAAATVGVFFMLMPIPAIPLSLISLALLPIMRSATIVLSLFMIPLPLLAWLAGASPSLVAYSVGLPIMVGLRHYFSSRNLQRLKEGDAGGQALPQG